MSFLDTLQEYVFLRYVLMIFGVVLFVIGMLVGWHELRIVVKLLLVLGAIAFFVGFRYNRIYR